MEFQHFRRSPRIHDDFVTTKGFQTKQSNRKPKHDDTRNDMKSRWRQTQHQRYALRSTKNKSLSKSPVPKHTGMSSSKREHGKLKSVATRRKYKRHIKDESNTRSNTKGKSINHNRQRNVMNALDTLSGSNPASRPSINTARKRRKNLEEEFNTRLSTNQESTLSGRKRSKLDISDSGLSGKRPIFYDLQPHSLRPKPKKVRESGIVALNTDSPPGPSQSYSKTPKKYTPTNDSKSTKRLYLPDLFARPAQIVHKYDLWLSELRSPAWSIALIGVDIWVVKSDGSVTVITKAKVGKRSNYKTFEVWKDSSRKGKIRKIPFHCFAVKHSAHFGVIAAGHPGHPVLPNFNHTERSPPQSCLFGLVVIDSDGRIQDGISLGAYNDVRIDGNRVYGLRHNGRKITIHERQKDIWVNTKTIQIKTESIKGCQRFSIHGNYLYLSSVTVPESFVLKHDIECEITKFIATYGKSPGQFKKPSVAFCDDQGNVLICDTLNDRVQLGIHGNEWRVLDVGHELYCAVDAAVNDMGQLLILCQREIYVVT